jgi:energy-coupling factor transporter ATP-binding protein EcfA2
MSEFNEALSYFARVNFRDENQRFGIKQKDRLQHLYCLGKSGSGKTTLLETLMKQDAKSHRGFAYFDPHGDSVNSIYKYLKKIKHSKTHYFDLTSENLELGYNPLRKVAYQKRSLVASSILEIFKRNSSASWGLKLEHILRQVIITLIHQPSSSFSDIQKILLDSSFRSECICNIKDEKELKLFWDEEFPKYKLNTDLLPVLNKIGVFLSHPVVRKVLIENKKQISFRRIMDQKEVLLVNMSKGAIGTDVANILGSLLLVSLSSAAYSRIDLQEEERIPFFLYLDEFQTISGVDLVSELLSQIRKFKVGLILSNQYLSQLDPKVRDAVLGNVGTLISFRTGIQDARILEKEFYPVFKATDFVSLANYEIYLRLLIDGKPSVPFSAVTLEP